MPSASRNPLRAAKGRRGSVATELVLMAPLLFIVVLCTTDLIRVFRAQLRMEMVAVQIGQIVSQCARIHDPADFTQFWGHATRIADGRVDVNSSSGGAIVISAISRNTATANRLNWQRRTGNASATSSFSTGVAPVIRGRNNQAFIVPANQTLFTTEVFAVIQPWVISAGLIGTALPREILGVTMFLSRATDPSRLQIAPTTSNVRDCTA